MELFGAFTVQAPRERVWAFFMNPRELSECISDHHTVEVIDADNFRGTIRSGVGFIKGTFSGYATIKERKPPDRATIAAHGTGMGSAFDIHSTIELSGYRDYTTVEWHADVTLSGKIATIGARVLQGTVDKKTQEFFDNARAKLEGPTT